MKELKLESLCTVVRGSSPRPKGDPRYYGGKVPRLMVADISRDGMLVTPSIDFLTEEGAKRSRPMLKGDFIIVVSGDPGEPCILNVDACIHDGLVGLRDLNTNEVFPTYLYHYFKYIKNRNKSQAVGAIYKNLNTAQIKALKIPLPPLPVQKKIAAILDEADRLRQLNQQVLDKYEALGQALFLEMFGDPVINPRVWDKRTINDISTIVTKGSSPKWQGFGYIEKGTRFITSENVRLGFLDCKKDKFVANEFHDKLERSKLKADDLLVNLVGASIGRGALVKKEHLPANINQAVAKIELDKSKINPRFLLSLIITTRMQEKLIGNKVEGARANISLKNVKELKIIYPPLSLQNEFVTHIQSIEIQKAQAQATLQASEDLFNSLLQKAFKGELA